ncbi:serine hydrolase [Geobacter sp. SVR]|uniref:serine hydrolase domain-containing protein n=1 Tax=Geobacter sp. SVR TaxID=2495594 RepID=UPI00143EFBDD|nr:serine hydrolase domain-containing protein [Geobacter sp. SVR]BCS53097.1 metal-dependent hydrolase [Geobacter sp. SVR]GCF84482.1 metal-dependent hydrolase [Geobacter sp. SVR]
MHRIVVLLTVWLLCAPVQAFAAEDLLEFDGLTTIDFILESATNRNLIAGGVVVIGNRDGILYSTARGRLNANENAPPLNDRTLFDIASLTKVFATTPAVMKLLEEGRISLMDPLTRWFPEFEGTGREDITILNLLTHTSGLDDTSFNNEATLSAAIQKAAFRKNGKIPGSSFKYADINFILLGELVRRVTGTTLDTFCREQIYGPLEMHSTTFLPGPEFATTIAPTQNASHTLVSGVVQDENARRLGGIAGHAGLFSSASDLARFSRLLLRGGTLDGRHIFSERVVAQMTAPYFYGNGAIVRGLGWDIESPFSAPRGSFFSEMSFGHTGYSGSSVWIDPQRDLFVILLTIRLDYRDTRQFNRLRSDISTLAAAAFWPSGRGRLRSDHDLLKP